MEASDKLEPLRNAVVADPENGGLRLVYADALTEGKRYAEATIEFQALFVADALPAGELITAGHVAIAAGAYSFATSLAAKARELGAVTAAAHLQIQVDEALERANSQSLVLDTAGPNSLEIDEPERTTFAAVGGLDEVKTAIERMIVLPFREADMYERYGRGAGGSLLLYGPPGCGKTLLARATAGECRLPFLNVRIEEIMNPYFGVSERNLHLAFMRARAMAPCVMFIDEVDAIGFARRKIGGGAGRPLVDQLLQELDAIGADNEGILVLAATNVPWDVDEALKRPGRFDRSVFVPPPDAAAREAILDVMLRGRPATAIDVRGIAEKAKLFSGADLGAVVERATDAAIDDAVASGSERPLKDSDLERALDRVIPSTLEWIATARRYVEFANDTGRYDDVRDFLQTGEAKSRKAKAR